MLTAVRVGLWELGTPWVRLLSGYPLAVPLALASVLWELSYRG